MYRIFRNVFCFLKIGGTVIAAGVCLLWVCIVLTSRVPRPNLVESRRCIDVIRDVGGTATMSITTSGVRQKRTHGRTLVVGRMVDIQSTIIDHRRRRRPSTTVKNATTIHRPDARQR